MSAEIVNLAERLPRREAVTARDALATWLESSEPEVWQQCPPCLAETIIAELEDRGFRIVPIEAGNDPA